MQVGDMVFFDTYKKDGHVGIYVGNGKFIGAQSSTGVATVDMTKGYWKDKFSGHVRRVAEPGKMSRADIGQAGDSRKSGGSYRPTYTDTWKLKKAAASAPGYKSFKNHLRNAVNTGKVKPEEAVALAELIGRESTWDAGAANKKSSARGYGQFLKKTRQQYEKKMKMSYSVPVNQIAMVRQYAVDRYGSVDKALKHWDKHNWY